MGLIDGNGRATFTMDVSPNKTPGIGYFTLCIWKDDNVNDCKEITFNYKVVPTSMEESQYATQLQVYPNPANETLTVSASIGSLTIQSLSIIDVMGKEVIQSTQNNIPTNLNISHLATGIYLLKAIDNDGKLTTQKFVKN